jgi:hypothetical protein
MTLADKQLRKESHAGVMARYFKVDSLKDDDSHLIGRYLFAALAAAVGMPSLFYLRFGEVSWFAIGFTVFLVMLCLLVALGLFFQNRSAFHTDVPAANNFADRIGAFWLVACAFGPFFGWLITTFPLSASSWRGQYLARVFFAVVLPVITAVPLGRYARGKAALIALPLLIGITALPTLSCWWVLGDLHDGALVTKVVRSRQTATGQLICQPAGAQYDLPCDAAFTAAATGTAQVSWLPHTGRVIEVRKF